VAPAADEQRGARADCQLGGERRVEVHVQIALDRRPGSRHG
jgi:hypothetical protein